MTFFSDFLVVSSCHPSIHTLNFGIWNVLRWYMSGQSFIYVRLVVSEFSNFKCFHTSWKYNFRPLLDNLLNVTPRIVVKFVWNSNHECIARYCSWHVTDFTLFLENTWNWARKLIFCLILRGFLSTTSYVLWVTPQSFAKWKVSWRYIIAGSFIIMPFVVVKW